MREDTRPPECQAGRLRLDRQAFYIDWLARSSRASIFVPSTTDGKGFRVALARFRDGRGDTTPQGRGWRGRR